MKRNTLFTFLALFIVVFGLAASAPLLDATAISEEQNAINTITNAHGKSVENTIIVKGIAKNTEITVNDATITEQRSAVVEQIERYEISVDFTDEKIKISEITFADIAISAGTTAEETIAALQVDTPPAPLETPVPDTLWANIYAIDPSALDFTEATVTVNATGTALYKCKDWNFSGQLCNGNWTLFMENLTPGTTYNFTLTPDDPGFGEIIAVDAAHLN